MNQVQLSICDTAEYNQYIRMKRDRQKQKEEIAELEKRRS